MFIFCFLEVIPSLKKKKVKKSKGIIKNEKSLGEIQAEIPFFIKPSEKIATIDTSKWPLLLKVMYIYNNFI